MKDPNDFSNKASVDEIRQRFDGAVERFSNLEAGQAAAVDSPRLMSLITQAAFAVSPHAKTLLDIGCGAGNNTLKALQVKADLDCDLLDLSLPMLERARQRVLEKTSGAVRIFQSDIRNAELPENRYDIVLSASVLHHLRDDADWEHVFAKIFRMVKPGGSFWISDLVFQAHPAIQTLLWEEYGTYLEGIDYPGARELVMEGVGYDDSPRPLVYQLALLEKVGFVQVDVLHKNISFAAFGGVKPKP